VARHGGLELGRPDGDEQYITIDARERKFLQRLAANFGIEARMATDVIEVMLLKNHL
jgi:hypothetical protein